LEQELDYMRMEKEQANQRLREQMFIIEKL